VIHNQTMQPPVLPYLEPTFAAVVGQVIAVVATLAESSMEPFNKSRRIHARVSSRPILMRRRGGYYGRASTSRGWGVVQTLYRIIFFVLLVESIAPVCVAVSSCTGLMTDKVAYTEIKTAVPVAAGRFKPSNRKSYTWEPPIDFEDLPAFCRVTGVI